MPRKKGVLAAPSITSNDARPRRQRRERLPSIVLEELWSIWRADPRVPSVESRRSWATSRNANLRLVDGWFSRRRACAKKAGQPIPDETYDLPLGPPTVPKREPSIEPELESVLDVPSDDTLVLVYPPYTDELNIEASSDTVFEDASEEPKRTETPAHEVDHWHSQPGSWLSSVDLGATEDCCHHDAPLLENSSLPVCNQGQGKHSNFTCILCSTRPVQDEVAFDPGATLDATGNIFISCPRLDFNSSTLSELSAIPFLFRTPRTVFPDDTVTHQTMNNWTIVDELGRLVNDGKLDFSFLDVPHLASMKLID